MKMTIQKWFGRVAFSLAATIALGSVLSTGDIADAQETKKPAVQQKNKEEPKGKESKPDVKSEKKKKADSKEEKSAPAKKETKKPARRRRVPRYEKFQKFSPKVRDLLAKQVGKVAKSTVEIFCGDDKKSVALGTVVDKRGFVMTKASRLTGAVRCKLPGGKSVPAIVCGIDNKTDLALLRLQAFNLVPVDLDADDTRAKEGHWLLSPAPTGNLVSYGVLSVAKRMIPPVPGFIGINMRPSDKNNGVVITEVVPKSAASKYGLKKGDRITKINSNSVAKPDQLSRILRTKRPGDVVSLSVIRGKDKGGKSMSFQIVLGNRREDNPQAQRSLRQNTMSGAISKRRYDFPMAIQHDTVLRPQDCGGPITDLDGNVIGVNIARSGRVMSYALPMKLVRDVYKKLATGEFSPEVVYKDKIDGFSKILANLESQSKDLSKKVETLMADQKKADKVVEGQKADVDLVESEIEKLKSKMAELEKSLKEKQEVLTKGKMRRIQINSNIKKSKKQVTEIDKQKGELKKKLNALLFGSLYDKP